MLMCVEILLERFMGMCCGFPTVFRAQGNAVEMVESDVKVKHARLWRLVMSRMLGRARPV